MTVDDIGTPVAAEPDQELDVDDDVLKPQNRLNWVAYVCAKNTHTTDAADLKFEPRTNNEVLPDG